jgi:hypothetical protein
MNKMKLTFEEGRRLEDMAIVLDRTCQADEMTFKTSNYEKNKSINNLTNQGRLKIDYTKELIDDIETLKLDVIAFRKRPNVIVKPLRSSICLSPASPGTLNLMNTTTATNSSSSSSSSSSLVSEQDTTASLIKRLDAGLELLKPMVATFSLVDQNEYKRLYSSTESTEFLTYKFLYRFLHDEDGQSVCSLAVIAGAESMLQVIYNEWGGISENEQTINDLIKNDDLSIAELKSMGFDCKTLRTAGLA